MRDERLSSHERLFDQLVFNEHRVRTLVDKADVCIHEINLAGEIISMNPAGLAMLGLEEEHDIIGVDYISLVAAQDKERIRGLLEAAYRGVNSEFQLAFEVNGERLFFSSCFIALRTPKGNIARVMGVTQDITELREAQLQLEQKLQKRSEELQLIHQQLEDEISNRVEAEQQTSRYQRELSHVARVNSIGAMATGIVHELNQPLSSAANFLQGCILRLKQGNVRDDELLSVLEKVDVEVGRAGSIVRRMHDFVRPGVSQKQVVNVNDVVMEMVELLQMVARQDDIAIECSLDDQVPALHIDRTQIGQVLVNLIKNAMEVTLEHNCHPRQVHISTALLVSGEVEVKVCDFAGAIAPDQTENIFSPFVTTKAEGLGMGLAICRMIAEAHHGHLSATSDPGVCSCFRFRLPVSSSGDDLHS